MAENPNIVSRTRWDLGLARFRDVPVPNERNGVVGVLLIPACRDIDSCAHVPCHIRHDCHIPLDRQTFLQTSVAGSFSGTDFCLIFAPCEGYDEPEILPSSSLMSADGGH
jgi:hypothetical protein